MVSEAVLERLKEIAAEVSEITCKDGLHIVMSVHSDGSKFIDVSDRVARMKAGDKNFRMDTYYITYDGKTFKTYEADYPMEGEDDGK